MKFQIYSWRISKERNRSIEYDDCGCSGTIFLIEVPL